MTDFAAHLADVIEWLDTEPPVTLDPEMARLAIQMIKLGSEMGEMFNAFEGATGLNPRKGVYASKLDVKDEICDVWITAAMALARMCGSVEAAMTYFDTYVAARNVRVKKLLEDACARRDADTPLPGDPREQVIRLLAQYPPDWDICIDTLSTHPDFVALRRSRTWLRAQVIHLADQDVVARTPGGFRNTGAVHFAAGLYDAEPTP